MSRASKGSPRLVDVGLRAGVSAQTVSRVINGHPQVAESTRRKVHLAMHELGYRLNLGARMLASGRPAHVGVLVAIGDASEDLVPEVVRAVHDSGMLPVPYYAGDATDARRAARRFADLSVETVVVCASRRLREVMVSPFACGAPHVVVVDGREPALGRLVLQHLVSGVALSVSTGSTVVTAAAP